MADPPDSEPAGGPAGPGGERVQYLDAHGEPAAKEQAQIAVIRDWDERGNVISMITERLTR